MLLSHIEKSSKLMNINLVKGCFIIFYFLSFLCVLLGTTYVYHNTILELALVNFFLLYLLKKNFMMMVFFISLLSMTRISAFSMIIIYFFYHFVVEGYYKNFFMNKNFFKLCFRSAILFTVCFLIMFIICLIFFGKLEYSLVFIGLNVPGQGLIEVGKTTNVFGFLNDGVSDYGIYNFSEQIMSTSPLTVILLSIIFIGNFIFLITENLNIESKSLIFFIINLVIFIIQIPIFNFGEPRNYATLIPVMTLSIAYIMLKKLSNTKD